MIHVHNPWADWGADHDVNTINTWAEVQSAAGLSGEYLSRTYIRLEASNDPGQGTGT